MIAELIVEKAARISVAKGRGHEAIHHAINGCFAAVYAIYRVHVA